MGKLPIRETVSGSTAERIRLAGEHGIKPNAVIFDIDGTLASMTDRGPFEWGAVDTDAPHTDIIALVQMFKDRGYKIIIVSGRDGSAEYKTRHWLRLFSVPFDELFLRPEGNYEKDYVIKERIYKNEIEPKYKVRYVFDDRDQTVKQWRDMGLRCLQVAPGDF